MRLPAQQRHDPGGRRAFPLQAGVRGAATFSDCNRYRPKLSRDWTPEGEQARTILWVGMNPSTANPQRDDLTCRREVNFSLDWGYTRYLKGNVLDWRATRPRDIPLDPELARSPANLDALADMAVEADHIMLAHGDLKRVGQVLLAHEAFQVLQRAQKPISVLGYTGKGMPRHTRVVPRDSERVEFRGYPELRQRGR